MSAPAKNPVAYRDVIASRVSGLEADFQRLFAGGAPAEFVWEIGCGHGHFLNAYAAAHPGKVCVGIDIVGDRIQRAVRKRDRGKLSNLHFIHSEARLFLSTLPKQVLVKETFILFPDPWPKKRHHKHRILQPDFLTALAERASADAHVHFRTDFLPYFEEAKAVFGSHSRWRIDEAIVWPFEHETVFQARAEGSYHSLSARLVPCA